MNLRGIVSEIYIKKSWVKKKYGANVTNEIKYPTLSTDDNNNNNNASKISQCYIYNAPDYFKSIQIRSILCIF